MEYDEDSHEYNHEDLDTEYAYKKFIRSWELQTEVITTETPIVFNIIKKYQSEYSEITSLQYFGDTIPLDKVRDGHFLCKYNPTPNKYFNEICDKYNIADRDPTTHSGLRYHKVNGEFIFDDTFNENNIKPVLDTYENCVKIRNELYERIEHRIKENVVKKELETQLACNPGKIIGDLVHLRNYFKVPESKTLRQANNFIYDIYGKLDRTIRNIIEKYPEIVDQKTLK
jgi:hypothetical protein